jgi:glycosyltransferase involved in cell wall biosynthesis
VKIALVQTYPVYHDGVAIEEWLGRHGREQWMAEYLAGLGHEVEFWAVDDKERESLRPAPGGQAYVFRAFIPDSRRGPSRRHRSAALLEHARRFRADVHILKGVDGGVGRRLLAAYLVPEGRGFAFICGGGARGRYVPEAKFVFYEAEAQRTLLLAPRRRPWRAPRPAGRLIFLPKAVDTDLFTPGPAGPKDWDLIGACRLVNRLKNLDAVGCLGRRFRLAVAGSGPDEARLKRKYPEVDWLGLVPFRDLPRVFHRARAFFHTGVREFWPRAVPEAMACGLPVVAFSGKITRQVVPADCGLLVRPGDLLPAVTDLLGDEERLRSMGRRARAFVEGRMDRTSCRGPLDEMLKSWTVGGEGAPDPRRAGEVLRDR